MDSWIEKELKECILPDVRLKRRLQGLVERLSDGLGKPIPLACQDWAGTKAAYRFFDNPRVDEFSILAGHFEATRARFAASSGMVFVVHDTTEVSYKREHPEQIGKIRTICAGKYKNGHPRLRTLCGVLMHSSLVLTSEGIPLGIAASKFWTRKKFKGANALKKKVNPTRVPIEKKESIRWIENLKHSTRLLGAPDRCVHIGDRESDIYELFCTALALGTHFLVRTCVDRLAEDGRTTVYREMQGTAIAGIHQVSVQNQAGRSCTAKLRVRYRRINVLPPIGKEKHYQPLSLSVIHAREDKEPAGRERIDWKLVTDLPVESMHSAIEKLDWYAMRWKIETFHKILKSGCRVEELKLRTAERLTNLLAIYCILSWRIFWLCMVNRADPDAPASLVFTETELQIMDTLSSKPPLTGRISHYLYVVARLGGYLDRKSDPPPGNMVLWRGFARLTDIHLGFALAARLVGN